MYKKRGWALIDTQLAFVLYMYGFFSLFLISASFFFMTVKRPPWTPQTWLHALPYLWLFKNTHTQKTTTTTTTGKREKQQQDVIDLRVKTTLFINRFFFRYIFKMTNNKKGILFYFFFYFFFFYFGQRHLVDSGKIFCVRQRKKNLPITYWFSLFPFCTIVSV